MEVELLVNGVPTARRTLPADGTLRDLSFEVPIKHSSWVAARIFPSSHTNPIWVTVDDQPVRASRRSAEWCLEGVKRCRTQKLKFIRAEEKPDFHALYEDALDIYERIIAESVAP